MHDAHASHFIYFSTAAPSKEVQATAFERLALLSEETGLLALGPVSRSSCSGSPGNTGLAPLLQALHFSATHRFCHGDSADVTWPVYGSSFVVSHRRASAQPHSLYRALRQQLELPGEHWIHANPAGSGGGDAASGSSAERPMLGAAIELSWGLLFNCTVLRAGDACGAGAPQGCMCEEEACSTCQSGAKGHWCVRFAPPPRVDSAVLTLRCVQVGRTRVSCISAMIRRLPELIDRRSASGGARAFSHPFDHF